jgi:hypothetical protein
MFAPLISQASVKTAARPSSKPSFDSKRLIAPQFHRDRDQSANQSWDFCKLAVFPPERPRLPRPPSLLLPPRNGIHRKLVIGEVDDPLEREADHLADQVMRMPEPELSVSAGALRVSRKCACEEEQRLSRSSHEDPPI